MIGKSTEFTQPAAPTPDYRNPPVHNAVTIGTFVALYIVLLFICGMTIGTISSIMVLLPAILGIFGGLVSMVLLGEVQRTGIFLIMGLIVRLMMISMTPGGIICYMMITGGVIAEAAYWLMGHKSSAFMTVVHMTFVTSFTLDEYIPFVRMKGAYLELYANGLTLDVAKVGMDMLSPVTMAIYCLFAIVACVIRCFWNRALARRRSSRARIV